MTKLKTLKTFKVFAPLHYFPYYNNALPTHKILQIKKIDNLPRLKGLQKELSKSELEDCSSSPYWLIFEYKKGGTLDDSTGVILFLLGLWLEIPTRTQAMQIFELAKDKYSKEKSFTRCLDRFQWNKQEMVQSISKENINNTLCNFDLLLPLARRKKRLFDALVMTTAGCMSCRWQVAYICFSAAAETLLTYKEGPGITKRLAKSYACLMETNVKKRNKEYRKFIKLYKVRSDIVHGRMSKVGKTTRNKAEKRLTLLAEFSLLLRHLWKKILADKHIVSELEKGDSSRERFFNGIERGYHPLP